MSNNIESFLSNKEQTVYSYIKEKTNLGTHSLKESMKTIGENLELSEATVHRAMNKLVSHGFIGLRSSPDKSEPNVITYYGEPVAAENLSKEPFFEIIMELNQRASRFKSIVETYQKQYEEIKSENEVLRKALPATPEGESNILDVFNEEKEAFIKQINRLKSDKQSLSEQIESLERKNLSLQEQLELSEAEKEEAIMEKNLFHDRADEADKKAEDLVKTVEKLEWEKLSLQKEFKIISEQEKCISYDNYNIKSSDIVGVTDIDKELIAFIVKNKQ